MYKIVFVSSLLLPAIGSAEIEKFDMALAGDFQKDYCELALTNPNPNIELDFTTQTARRGIYRFSTFDTGTVASIACTPGTYQVAMLSSDGGYMNIDEPIEGIVLEPSARVYYDNIYEHDAPLFVWHESLSSDVVIDSYREVVRYEIYFNVSLPEEVVGLLGESISSTSQLSFVIEKK